MAEPRNPRRAGPLWLWVLGLLAVLLAIWVIVRLSRGEGATVVEDGALTPTAPGAVVPVHSLDRIQTR